MSNYIISDNDNIIGCFNEKINAIIFLMDIIINKFNFYLEVLKLNGSDIIIPDLNSFKITSVLNNSTNVKAIDIFDIKNFKLRNIITGEDEFISSSSDNLIFNYKINILKQIIFDINQIKNTSELNIFIPSNALNTEAINNIIINSPKSCDLNCVDNKIKNIDKMESKKVEKLDLKKFKEEKEKALEKEKLDEFKRRYESDKQIYLKLKDEIEDNQIPELFQDQYPIMKILDNMKILNEDNGFNFYYKKMCEILKNKTNIYSSMFNDSSYFYASKKNIEFSSSESSEEDESDVNQESDINI